MIGRNNRIAAFAAFAVGSGAALWVLWGPMISHKASGGSLRLCMKNFYAPDQYAVLGIARLAQDGLSVYHEPYSATGTSVYPSEYYWLLGLTADATGTTVVWAWNVVGLIVSMALIALAVVWAVRLAPGTRAWVLAPAPFLLGTLFWWDGHGWLYAEGQAVLWPPVAGLYSPGAEGPALLMTGISLIVLVAALGREGRRAIALAAGSGVATGLTLHLHANVAIFCVVATVLILLWDELLGAASTRRRALVAGGAAALVVAAALGPQGGVLPRLALLIVALAAALVTDATWRRDRGRLVIAWAGAALLASLPLSVRLAAQTLGGEGYFYDRQASVAVADTSLPILAVLVLMLPMWALSAAVVVRLTRDGARATPGWAALVAGLGCATLLLTLAGNLGAEGLEWHRFLINGSVLTTMAAAPGLWLLLRDAPRLERGVGWGVAALLAATFPTTIAFADAQRGNITCTPPQEAEAFREIGRAAGNRLLLVDRCFPPGPLRVLSGVRIVRFNAGIAVPPDRTATEAALAAIQSGHLPSAALIRRTGATGFLTNTLCAGIGRDEIAARLDAPYARIPLRNGEELGLPPGLVYELYGLLATRPTEVGARAG